MEQLKKYLDRNWWTTWLESIFPEVHYSPDPDWGLYFPFHKMVHTDTIWYKKGNILLIVKFADPGRSPYFYVRIIGRKEIVINFLFDFSNLQLNLNLIEALAKPEMAPLCIGIDWAAPVVEHLIANYQPQEALP